MAWIYNKNGVQLCEVKKLSYNGAFMDVSSITVTVESNAPIAFSIGDYIDWDYDGLRYTLDTAAGVEKQARRNSVGNAFVYENLVFLSPLGAAGNADFLDVVLGNTNDFLTNTEFSFYGTAWDYAKRLEANLCRLYGSGSWKVRIWTEGVCYDVSPATGIDTGAWESKLVDVSKLKCLGGLQQIYDLWGCAYVFSVVNGVNYVDFYDDFEQYAKAWKQGGVDKIFAYGKGNGLYKIRHTPDADHVLVTRLRAYGSSGNLPANYYLNSPDYHVDGNESSELAIANLMLPASEWTKGGVKHPSNAYLEQNTDLYGVREASVAWDGSDPELGEIKPTIYGLTIQDLLNLMQAVDSYRPVEAKWPDTSQRIDKIITGAAPADNGAVAEAGYDFTVVESTGSFAAHSFGASKAAVEVDFSDLVMGTTPSVSNLAEYRIVPTGDNEKVVSFDVTHDTALAIRVVTAYLTPYVGGVKVEDATIPCTVSHEAITNEVGGVVYRRRYFIHLRDSAGSAIVFSTMLTGAVTFRIYADVKFNIPSGDQFPVVRNEYAVGFKLLRGNKAIDKFFAVTIPQIGFDLAGAVTGNAKLCMRSGANQPREFPIVPASVRYNEATDTWYVRCKRVVDQSTKTYFPNSDAVIAAGDEYYFSGIAMPSLYVEIAAHKLLEAATAWLNLHSKPRMLSSVDVDNKIMAVEGIVLKEGMSLPLSDTDLGIRPDTQESRIIDNIRIEEGSNAIRTFTITLRDKKEKSSLDAAIRGATSGFATSASVSEAVGALEDKDHASLSGRDMPNQHPISAISGLENALATLSFFEEDGNGNVKLKDEYGGLWATGFVSAGGVSDTGGGGGGGLTPAGMWELLGASTIEKIASSHIKLGSGLGIDSNGNIYVTSPGLITTVAGVAPVNGDIPVAGLQNALGMGIISDALQSLQSQIDSVAARSNFDILTATSLFSDVITTPTLYAGAIELNGSSLATTLGNFALKATSISVGAGLSGGGTLAADRTISLSSQTIASLALADSAYQLPNGGIPEQDLASALVTKISHGESAYNDLNKWFEEVTENGVTYLKLKTASGGIQGFATPGFVSAGGVSPNGGGGGGGGLTPSGMWQLLGADTTEPISAYHIPIGTGLGIDSQGNIVVTSPGSVVGIKIGATTYSPSSGIVDITAGIPDIGPLSEAVMSLQSQIDSVASRDCFDELTVTTLFSDVLAASDAYLDTLSLGGRDLAAWLGTLVPKTTTVNGKALTGNITLDKGDVGLGNVTNLAASAYFTEFDNGSGEHANKVVATIGGTTKRLTVGYATKALGDKNGNDIYATYVSGVSVGSGAQKDNLLIAKNGSNSAITVPYATISQKTRFTPAYSGASEIEPFLDWFVPEEYATGKFRLRLNPKYDGMYADGFVSAGGPGSGGGGGGGGLSPLGMWQLLTNDDTLTTYDNNTKISLAHIPEIPWSQLISNTIPTTLAQYGITDAKFSSAGVSDKIRITLGANYHDVLTAHQSLSGYATETWVGQQGFITKAVNDLTNYYLKTETYSRTDVNNLIGAINQFHYEIAASTSAVTNPQSNVLYLIGPTGSGSDKYEEYVYDPTKNPAWVKIGDTSIDLSAYVNSVVASGSGNYISGFTKSGSTLTLTMGTLPTSLPASDVYAWAKKSSLDAADVPALAISKITGLQTALDGKQPLDADLTSIAGLTGTSGFLKKAAANTWALDTTVYVPETRTVNGHALSSNVTVTKGDVGLGNVENTALSTWAGTQNITTLGTITTGVWHGSAIANSYLANSSITIGSTAISLGGTTSTLAGLTSVTSQRFYLTSDLFFEVVNGNVHLHTPSGKGFYVDGFVSAGGLNPNSGGSGINEQGLWEILGRNSGEGLNKKIHTAHLPDLIANDGLSASWATSAASSAVTTTLTIGVASGRIIPLADDFDAKIDRAVLWAQLQNNDNVTTYNNYKIHANHIPDMASTYGYLKSADLTVVSDALQSLQSQIDSVATRDMFDELKASAFYADMAAVSSLGVDSIELAGSTISAWGSLFSSLTSSGTTITAVIGGQSRTHTISASDLIGTIANNPVNRATADANGNIIASTYRTIDSLKSKGSATLPVYFDSNGNAQTITSYEGNAASASRLQGTATYALWGQTYWQNGVPQSVTAAPNLYIGGSKVLSSAATQALLGITSISAAVSPGAQDETRIEWDSEHHAWHFYGGIYADSFVSAGGLNEDSGGGGGITPEGLWEILGDDSTNEKIASTHIKIGSGLAIDGLGNIYVTSPGIITTVAGVAPVNGDIPVASLKTALGLKALAYKDSLVASDIPNLSWNKITSDKPNSLSGYGITNAYTKGEVDGMISALNVSEISEAVMSLQSQVDSVAARDMFDELKASVLFADTASVADLYPETIHLGSKSLTSSSTVVTINGTAVALAGSFNTASVTAGTAGTSSATSGYTLAVPYVTYNQYGIITGAGTHTHTINNIPNSSLANSTIKINGTTTALGGSINVGTVTSVATGTGLTGGTITGSGTISINSTYLGYIDNGNTAYGWGTTISNALQSLQSQIDSVAARSEFDNLTATVGYFDMLSVGESVGIGGALGVTGATTLNGTTINGATYIYNTLQVGTSATARDSIFYGKIYIGAATPYINYANSALHTNVGFYSDSFITAGATASSSDARLKDDIHSVTPERAISLLSSLHGCEWTWNNKKDYLAGKHGSGLIAQEVEKVMPWAVLDLNGEYSLNYNTLWGIAIPVMQDHESRIRELEAEVKRLKAIINQ